MAKWANDSGEVSIKVAVVGQPGSGKSMIIACGYLLPATISNT